MKTNVSNPLLSALFALPIVVSASGSALAQAINKHSAGTDLTVVAAWGAGSGPVPTSTNVATWVTGSLGGSLTIGSAQSWQGIDIQGANAAITTSGAGTLTLGSSGINISSGGVDLNIVNSVTVGTSQNWTVGSGRTFTTSSGGKTLAINNSLTLDGAGIVFIGGASGSTALTGAANLNINNGRLAWGTQTGSSVAGYSGQFVLNSGGKLSINTSNTLPALTINGGTIGSFNGTARTESGTLTIGGDFTVGGSETANVVGNISTGNITFSGATNLGGAVRSIDSRLTGGQGVIFSGLVSNGGLTVNSTGGAGILTLSNDTNSYSSATTVTSGYLAISNKAISNSSSISLAANTRLFVGVNGTTNINNLSGVSAASIRTDFTITGTAGARTLQVNQSTDGTFAGTFTEGSSGRTIALLKTGTAKLTLSGTGGYTGGTTISQGALAAITNSTALGASGTVTLNDANTGANNTALLLGNVTMARPITVANQGSGTTTLGANGGAALPGFSGAITLAKGVTLDGTGNTDRLTFSGGIGGTGDVIIAGGTNRVVFSTTANTYSGTTTISTSSILQLGTGGSTTTSLIPDASVVTVNSGGYVKLAKGSNSETIGGLAGSGTVRGHEGVASTASTLTIDGGASQDFSGGLEDGGATDSTLSLVKTGAGTQMLSGANTYTGPTTVTAGTLAIASTGSLGNTTTTVESGGTLAGAGSIGGSTTIQGIHSPGFSAGLQSFSNGLTYAATGKLAWELTDDTTVGRGTSYDALNVTGGALGISIDSTIDLAFGGAVDFSDPFWGANQEWLVVDLSGTATAADSSAFKIGTLTGGANWSPSLGGFGIERKPGSNTADSVYLTWAPVPEPATSLLAAFGLLALGRRRR